MPNERMLYMDLLGGWKGSRGEGVVSRVVNVSAVCRAVAEAGCTRVRALGRRRVRA